MTAPEKTALELWRIVPTPLHALAICFTTFRIHHRRRKRQLWWDDYCAGAALLVDIGYMISPWLRCLVDPPQVTKSQKMRMLLYWCTVQLFPIVIWTARISIGLSIARLTPPKTHNRYLLYAMSALFAVVCTGEVVQKFIVCMRSTSWRLSCNAHCHLNKSVGIISLCTDLGADTFLFIIPLRILWRVKLPRRQRRLILSIFAATLTNSLVGLVYAVFVFVLVQLKGNNLWSFRVAIVSGVKTAVTLLVCNLLVIVTYLYSVFWKDDGETVSEPSETRDKPTHTSSTPPMPGPTMLTFKLTEISTLSQTTKSTVFSGPFTEEAFMPVDPDMLVQVPNHCHTI